ncbi:MAG: ATP synthase F1 subunit gamma [Bacteroidetes bacterium GWF2_49_14]|nr:MAG: ATP synthase F1 subunit gamma [Bacteroidetes bacterium GWF2_49_14]
MGSLKEIRQRITSVKSTRQITSAMKMVSAAKLKKAQDAIIQIRPYAARLHQVIGHVSTAAEENEISPLTQNREPQKVLLVVVSANRGLCGGFNSNIVKAVIELASTRYAAQRERGNLHMTIIGKKGGEVLKTKGFSSWPQNNDLLDKPAFIRSEKFANQLMDQFIKGEYDRIELIYNQFKNAASQVVMVEPFLPVQPSAAEAGSRTEPFFIFEPDLDYLVTRLIPEALRIQLHKSLLDSQASEHGARMTAMHQATDNATDMIRDLTLEYNKARQAAITSEIIEIVSGAEALTS